LPGHTSPTRVFLSASWTPGRRQDTSVTRRTRVLALRIWVFRGPPIPAEQARLLQPHQPAGYSVPILSGRARRRDHCASRRDGDGIANLCSDRSESKKSWKDHSVEGGLQNIRALDGGLLGTCQ